MQKEKEFSIAIIPNPLYVSRQSSSNSYTTSPKNSKTVDKPPTKTPKSMSKRDRKNDFQGCGAPTLI
jgi:hypothetical protein